MTGFASDLLQSARRLFAAPGFTLATVLSIGLGVGVNTTVFTAANDLLLKPLGVPRAGEMVHIYDGHHSPLSGRKLREVQGASSFASVFGEFTVAATLLSGTSDPERVRAVLASDNIFRTLEVIPALGRLFVDDSAATSTAQVVLSHEFWLRRFGGDPGVVGRSVRINSSIFTITGVAPPGTHSGQVGWWSDVIVPTRDARALVGLPVDSIGGSFYTTARLASGVSHEQANAELQLIASRIARADTSQRDQMLRALPARGLTEEVRLPAQVASLFMLAIGLLVLVMAATNVGNLMLARNASRRRELGVRMALGAPRGRLMQLLLSESLILALLACVTAWLLAAWGSALLPRLIPAEAEVRLALDPDWRVFAFMIGVAGFAVVLFGLVPARIATRRDVAEGIKTGSSIGSGVDGARVRRRFLMVQVALCALLLSTGSLFVRGLGRVHSVDVGFNPRDVVVAQVDLSGRQMTADARRIFFDRLLAETMASAGVASATYEQTVSLTGANSQTTMVSDAAPDSVGASNPYFNIVGPAYHQALGIALIKGRDFLATDGAGAPLVAIVNETFAAREWPGEDPIGRRISTSGPGGPWMEVIGVSRNVKYHTLGEDAKPFVTMPYGQQVPGDLALLVRVAPGASARDVMAQLTRRVRTIDPLLPMPAVRVLTDMQAVTLLPARLGAVVLGGIGGLAFLLAAVGVGGVAAYTVAQRTREIGVRVALGANPGQLLTAVLGDTGRTVAVGASVGLIAALGVSRLLASQLYGLSLADPVTFSLVPILLLALAGISAFVPARRAMAIPATEALRAE